MRNEHIHKKLDRAFTEGKGTFWYGLDMCGRDLFVSQLRVTRW